MALDAVTATQGVTSHTDAQTSWSWTHTCTGSDLILFVQLGHAETSRSAGAVTYNGVNMAYLGIVSGGGYSTSELWVLLDPATGANTVSVTYATSYNDSAHSSVSFTNVDSYTNYTNNSGLSTAATVTVTTTSGNVVFAVGSYIDAASQTTVTLNEGTKTHDYDSGNSGGDILSYGGYRTADASSEVFTFSSDASLSDAWAVHGIELIAPSGGVDKTQVVSPVSVGLSLLLSNRPVAVLQVPVTVAIYPLDGYRFIDIEMNPPISTVAVSLPRAATGGLTVKQIGVVTVGVSVVPRAAGASTGATIKVDPISVGVSVPWGEYWYELVTISSYEVGYFARDTAEPVLALVYGLDRTLPRGWSSGEGWQIVSKRFVFNDTPTGKTVVDRVVDGAWTADKGSSQTVLTGEIDRALQGAGFRRPGGGDIVTHDKLVAAVQTAAVSVPQVTVTTT